MKISDKIFDKLYTLGKFEDVSSCIACSKCGSARKPMWLYLYPGELEYRRKRKLIPDFDTVQSRRFPSDIVCNGVLVSLKGDRHFRCPFADTGLSVQCKSPPITCRTGPIQIFELPNGRAIVELEPECSKVTLGKKYVLELITLVLELYVNLKVGE